MWAEGDRGLCAPAQKTKSTAVFPLQLSVVIIKHRRCSPGSASGAWTVTFSLGWLQTGPALPHRLSAHLIPQRLLSCRLPYCQQHLRFTCTQQQLFFCCCNRKKKKLVFLKAVWSGGCISFCCDVFVLVSCFFFFSFPSSSAQPLCFPVSGFVFTLLTKLCILTCTFFFWHFDTRGFGLVFAVTIARQAAGMLARPVLCKPGCSTSHLSTVCEVVILYL